MKNDWQNINSSLLQKNWEFKNFQEALEFVNKVGELAEATQHHPDISIHDYNQVTISTTTHDVGKTLTENDYELAKKIDELK